MTDDEQIAMNRYKRPQYRQGERVRVISDGPFRDCEGEVTRVRALQTFSGVVKTYLYDIRLDNLAYQTWTEEQIAPPATLPFPPKAIL